jgi:hypothetical protein
VECRFPSLQEVCCSAPPSFMEVLLSGVHLATASQESVVAHKMASVVAGDISARATPRIVLLEEVCSHMKVARAPDADGWSKMESCRERQERRRQLHRPCRPIPADLRVKCFNCFSLDHCAAVEDMLLPLRCLRVSLLRLFVASRWLALRCGPTPTSGVAAKVFSGQK